MAEVLLDARGVTKRYGGLTAVDDVSFHVRQGETFGIAGPNGAGKTTLFDIVTGMTRLSAGEINLDGKPIHTKSVNEICHRGIARTFQLPSVFDTETVLANVVVGAHFGAGNPWWSGFRSDTRTLARAEAELDFVGLSDIAGDEAGPLAVFDKKRLMVASALASAPSMLFLDEPFGGLTPAEVDELVDLLRRVRERGITLVLIEHVMRALMALSDRVLIMNQGKTLFEGLPEEVLSHEEVMRVYLGGMAPTSKAKPHD
ncbi:ABC transporter ATP-binding protein [Glaciibacter psychrotolerans]|uniref:Branched-chain amino acid transport system ATP-binding protein n=1 Tax=Glaciibacter psychrotolerans TaxID=670054 RepID=A0A7Z0J738_9MICO|nr:ABC transporter ATP-binding protein [Leifsonia psychrotolerans]NYJ20524.1 branched-chain amino acid transport system ATP-binding protein [Leifsonia psychrotolerans]